MPIQIRQSAFETNSSSSHSITVSDDSSYDLMDLSLVPDQDGVITLNGQSFGWEWRRYNDAMTKAVYCAVDNGKDEDTEEDDEKNNSYKNLIKEVIKEQTGAKKVVFNISDDDYIDHQSVGTSYEVRQTKESLRNFIFNKNSWLFTGNDNTEAPINFYDPAKPIYQAKLVIDEVEQFICKKEDYDNLEEAVNDTISKLMDKYSWQYEYSVDLEQKTVTEKRNGTVTNTATFWLDENETEYIIYTNLNQYPVIANRCDDTYYLREKLARPWNHASYDWENQKEIPEFIENFSIKLIDQDWDHENKKWTVNGERTVKIKAELVPFNSDE